MVFSPLNPLSASLDPQIVQSQERNEGNTESLDLLPPALLTVQDGTDPDDPSP